MTLYLLKVGNGEVDLEREEERLNWFSEMQARNEIFSNLQEFIVVSIILRL